MRRGRRVVPTEAGLTVYRYARGVLQATQETEQLVRELVAGDGGLIAVGVATAICSYTFPPVWRGFARDHPRTQLVLRLGDSRRVLEETLDGTVDLGIALPGSVPADLVAHPLGPVEVLLVAAAEHPLAGRTIDPQELVGQTLLCTNSTPSYENLVQNLVASGVSGGYSVVHFGDTETVKRGVEAGLGLAQLARAAVARELAGRHGGAGYPGRTATAARAAAGAAQSTPPLHGGQRLLPVPPAPRPMPSAAAASHAHREPHL